jgi:hypothetical protein
MIARAIGRIILVPLAFMLSAACAVMVMVTLGLERATRVLHGTRGSDDPEIMASHLGNILDLLLQGALLTSALSILPAVALVLVGEVARIRSWIYYVLGGGVTLALVPLIARLDKAAAGGLPPQAVFQVLATAGFAGGLVYWLLAGRRA